MINTDGKEVKRKGGKGKINAYMTGQNDDKECLKKARRTQSRMKGRNEGEESIPIQKQGRKKRKAQRNKEKEQSEVQR